MSYNSNPVQTAPETVSTSQAAPTVSLQYQSYHYWPRYWHYQNCCNRRSQKRIWQARLYWALANRESGGVSHGVVMNIEQCIASIELAISRCLESNPELDISEVYVGIAGQHIKSLQTRGDRVRVNVEEEISKADIDQLIADQGKTYIPAGDRIIDIIPQEFTVDSTASVLDPYWYERRENWRQFPCNHRRPECHPQHSPVCR